MPTNIEYNDQLIAAIEQAIEEESGQSSGTQSQSESEMVIQLIQLVNAIPYLLDDAWQEAHRGSMGTILATTLPNSTVIGPYVIPVMYSDTDGAYQAYRDAFYHGVSATEGSNTISNRVKEVNANLNNEWWKNYSVVVLTDAIRKQVQDGVSLSIDNNKLDSDLATYNTQFNPALTASYLGAFESAYQPTSVPLKALRDSGEASAAADLLDASIANDHFTANINEMMSTPGDSNTAATWFTYNLWVTLKALGYPDVDSAIERYSQPTGNMIVDTALIGPQNWWNGKYNSWYYPLNGIDVVDPAPEMINIPLTIIIHFYNGGFIPPSTEEPQDQESGYSDSFVHYGNLAWYRVDTKSAELNEGFAKWREQSTQQ